jgi:hypothetical protein
MASLLGASCTLERGQLSPQLESSAPAIAGHFGVRDNALKKRLCNIRKNNFSSASSAFRIIDKAAVVLLLQYPRLLLAN